MKGTSRKLKQHFIFARLSVFAKIKCLKVMLMS